MVVKVVERNLILVEWHREKNGKEETVCHSHNFIKTQVN